MQKAIIVEKLGKETNIDPTYILNNYLEEGWRVINCCAMPSSMSICGTQPFVAESNPICLVIIEKLL